jgi:hypothetical protein
VVTSGDDVHAKVQILPDLFGGNTLAVVGVFTVDDDAIHLVLLDIPLQHDPQEVEPRTAIHITDKQNIDNG